MVSQLFSFWNVFNEHDIKMRRMDINLMYVTTEASGTILVWSWRGGRWFWVRKVFGAFRLKQLTKVSGSDYRQICFRPFIWRCQSVNSKQKNCSNEEAFKTINLTVWGPGFTFCSISHVLCIALEYIFSSESLLNKSLQVIWMEKYMKLYHLFKNISVGFVLYGENTVARFMKYA